MKTFTSDLRRNLIKIFCLATGLAIGLLVVAKVYFEKTFDRFIPGIGQVYLVKQCAEQSGEYKEWSQTAGAIAPAMKRYVPQVEEATRSTVISYQTQVQTPDGSKYEVPSIFLADSTFFDVIKADIIEGDPHDALAVEWKCMIPKSLADRMGGDVMGTQVFSTDFGEKVKFEIAGVYEDFPLNSSFSNGIYLSLATIPHLMYDGRDNWLGNDRYKSYVRLSPGTSPDELKPYIEKMLRDNIDAEVIDELKFTMRPVPFLGLHAEDSSVSTMNWMLTLLGFIILASAALNYLLVVFAQMQWRGKEMAVRKCYGTSRRRIFGMVLGESLAFLAVSIGLAALIVASLAPQCRNLLGIDAGPLLSTDRLWILMLVICLVILCITGIIPAWLYCRTPVASAFRRSRHGSRIWKLALLSVQFFATGFLFCLLVIAMQQYRLVSNLDTGINPENLAFAEIHRIPQEERPRALAELRRLGSVASVATADHDFVSYASGNNIYNPEKRMNEVNISDLYYANPEVFDVIGAEFVQGGTFHASTDSVVFQVVVDERFIPALHKIQDFEGDEIVGRTFNISEHMYGGNNEYEVKGVLRTLRRNGVHSEDADTRGAVIFPTANLRANLFVRFHDMTPEALEEARGVLAGLYPAAEINLVPMRTMLDVYTEPVKHFGNSVMTAGIVIIIITLTGLIGYAADEVRRRAKEIAIRKVNGMSVRRILMMLCADILKVAVPSLALGAVLAVVAGKEWLSQFTDQVSVSPAGLFGVVAAVLVLLLAVVALASLGIVRSNPVRWLRDE